MNELQIFRDKTFGQVRIVEENGKVWICGKDVAQSLGYANPQKALRDHCKEDGVTFRSLIDSLGRKQEAKFINEGNLYRLISHSELPDAEQFESWIFDQVLPSIRKHGGYIAGQETMTDDELLARAYLVAQSKIKEKDEAIERMKPKEIFTDAVSASKTSILIGEMAKILKQNGVDMGQQRLFKWLRENGYLIKRNGSDRNMPTQLSMELGLFEIKETAITHSNGTITVSRTPKVTGKGQIYFTNMLIPEHHESVRT